MSDLKTFKTIVDDSVKAFPSNNMCKMVDNGNMTMDYYHKILLMIFHQTFQGPSTFALAGAHCPLELHEARDYLLHHADEEKNHWEWVINDLNHTGYTGPDPRESFPSPACQAYVAFNFYIAMKHPLSRLAIAAVLESIGANHSKKYAQKIVKTLDLSDNQASFFYGHGDTDIGHTEDIFKVLNKCNLSKRDWKWMNHSASTAFQLYNNMYNEAGQ